MADKIPSAQFPMVEGEGEREILDGRGRLGFAEAFKEI